MYECIKINKCRQMKLSHSLFIANLQHMNNTISVGGGNQIYQFKMF